MFSVCEAELGAAFETELGLNPRRLLVQNVEQLEHQLLGSDRMIKNRNAIVVVGADCRAVFYQATTQIAVSVLVSQK
jgi:hypothetical protein